MVFSVPDENVTKPGCAQFDHHAGFYVGRSALRSRSKNLLFQKDIRRREMSIITWLKNSRMLIIVPPLLAAILFMSCAGSRQIPEKDIMCRLPMADGTQLVAAYGDFFIKGKQLFNLKGHVLRYVKTDDIMHSHIFELAGEGGSSYYFIINQYDSSNTIATDILPVHSPDNESFFCYQMQPGGTGVLTVYRNTGKSFEIMMEYSERFWKPQNYRWKSGDIIRFTRIPDGGDGSPPIAKKKITIKRINLIWTVKQR
jgi:hypothetical protein